MSCALERQKNGEKTEMEYRMQHADGSIHWVWDRAFPVSDENGKVKMLAGIAADITERKLAEEGCGQAKSVIMAFPASRGWLCACMRSLPMSRQTGGLSFPGNQPGIRKLTGLQRREHHWATSQ